MLRDDLISLSPLLMTAKGSADAALAALVATTTATTTQAAPPGRYVAPGAPPPTPMDVAAGFATTPVFFDGFDDLSTVDLGYSYDPSKVNWMFETWYPKTDPLGAIAQSISIQNSLLMLTRDEYSNECGDILSTLVQLDNQGVNVAYTGPLVGVSVRGSHSITYAVSCNPAGAASFPRSWPAGWSLTREQQINVSPHIEIDDFEWMPRGLAPPYVATPIFSVRQWVRNASGAWSSQAEQSIASQRMPAGFDLSQMNLVHRQLKCSQDFGGVGTLQWFVAGPGQPFAHLDDCDVTWRANDGSPWNLLDTQSRRIILGCGTGFPASFDYVCVRALPGNSLVLN